MNNAIVDMMKVAEKQGWSIVGAVMGHDSLDYSVMVFRFNAPFKDDGKYYSVHRYDAVNKSFFSGVYDLTKEEAKEILAERM